ncbi:MAG: efflux RND transporter periplasmic adaptor subunit [Parcubacteria group bacterium]
MLALIAVVLLAAAALGWMLRPQAVPVETALVTRGPLETWIEEQGRTRVKEIYDISAPLAGQTEREELHAGDPVRKGEVVVLIRPAAPPLIDARSRQEFTAAAQAALASVRLAESDLKRAQAELTLADAEWRRGKTLAASGFLAQQGLDQRRMARDSASAAVSTAQAAVAVRRREYDSVRSRLTQPDETRPPIPVRSPVGGGVLKVLRESQQVVQPGELIMQVGDPRAIDVVVELLSTDAVAVSPGAPARIEGWGGPPLQAKVRRVEPSGFTKVSALGVEEQRVLTYLDFAAPEQAFARLGHDYRVITRIITWSTPQTLQVPTSALFRQGPDWAVYRVEGARAHLVKVQIGRRNEDAAQVLSGLSEGDRVVAYPGDRLSDGVRVKERR